MSKNPYEKYPVISCLYLWWLCYCPSVRWKLILGKKKGIKFHCLRLTVRRQQRAIFA